jgi:hypothetical protein
LLVELIQFGRADHLESTLRQRLELLTKALLAADGVELLEQDNPAPQAMATSTA